jgi:hypothetical protein
MRIFVENLRNISTILVSKFSGVFILNLGQKFKIVNSLQSVQRRIPAAIINFDKVYLLNH